MTTLCWIIAVVVFYFIGWSTGRQGKVSHLEATLGRTQGFNEGYRSARAEYDPDYGKD